VKNRSKRVEILEGRIKTLEPSPDPGTDVLDPEEREKRAAFARFCEKHRGRTFESHQQFMEAVLEDAVFDPTDPGPTHNDCPAIDMDDPGINQQTRQQAFRDFISPDNWPRTMPSLVSYVVNHKNYIGTDLKSKTG